MASSHNRRQEASSGARKGARAHAATAVDPVEPELEPAEGETAQSGRGRPRDPEVDRRIQEATLEVYGRDGLAGLHFDAVARVAGVGKAALYRRWESAEEMLVDVVQTNGIFPIAPHLPQNASLRETLLHFTNSIFERHLGKNGRAILRAWFDMVWPNPTTEFLRPHLQREFRLANRDARVVMRRAILRGELPERASATFVMDLAGGGVLLHFMSTPPERRSALALRYKQISEEIVDAVIAAAWARHPHGKAPAREPSPPGT